MKRKIFRHLLIALALPLLGLGATSCQEQDEAGEFDNWQARNQHYVDSIAALANAGKNGWAKIASFRLVEPEGGSLGVNSYIYVQKLEDGSGDRMPEYNDSIRIHYLGRLIPSASWEQGKVFGKSYSTYTLNEATDVPSLLPAGGNNVVGFSTAVMHMVEGDHWKVVIPYALGYGTSTNSSASIPGYSTLIFDMKLARIYRYKIDTNTTWH